MMTMVDSCPGHVIVMIPAQGLSVQDFSFGYVVFRVWINVVGVSVGSRGMTHPTFPPVNIAADVD